ncbi:hypothetical protein, partial [Aeromonas caviae]|uniref:hypothetical protein n=1 Tax=Aeromonas caviae TaxID=648 RepID=UPI0019D47EA9
FTTASVGIHDLAMSARRSLTRGIGELLRLLDPGLSDLVRTPQVKAESSGVLCGMVTPHVESWLMWGESPPVI